MSAFTALPDVNLKCISPQDLSFFWGDLEIDNLEDTAHRLANTVVFAEANDLPNQARLSLKLEGLCRR